MYVDTIKETGLRELALFAGAGGGILGGRLLNWRTVCAVEFEPYPAAVLCQRQNDGVFPPFPIWDDVRTFDGRPWRGIVDVVSGGFPCQDISVAGKGAGIEGERSGLWAEMHRIICEVRPRYAFVENSPMLTSRGLGRVLGDLAESGYDAAWCVLGADDVGAPHRRKRIWILAEDSQQCGLLPHAELHGTGRGKQLSESPSEADGNVPDSASVGCATEHHQNGIATQVLYQTPGRQPCGTNSDVSDASVQGSRAGSVNGRGTQKDDCGQWWGSEPGLGRVADGVAHRAHRLKAIGNGQVPLVAAVAFNRLREILENEGNQTIFA